MTLKRKTVVEDSKSQEVILVEERVRDYKDMAHQVKEVQEGMFNSGKEAQEVVLKPSLVRRLCSDQDCEGLGGRCR